MEYREENGNAKGHLINFYNKQKIYILHKNKDSKSNKKFKTRQKDTLRVL